jgi:hypothetical protein
MRHLLAIFATALLWLLTWMTPTHGSGDAAVPELSCVPATAVAGEPVECTQSPLEAGSEATFTWVGEDEAATTTGMATATAEADGTATASLAIEVAGSYTVTASGTGRDGETVVASTATTVDRMPATEPGSTAAVDGAIAAPDTDGSLTPTQWGQLGGLALAALAVLVIAAAAAWHRKKSSVVC